MRRGVDGKVSRINTPLNLGIPRAATASSNSLFDRGLWGKIISCTRMLFIYFYSVVTVGKGTDTI